MCSSPQACPKKQQGLAGAVIMLLLNLGIAVCLGFVDIVNTYTLSNLGEKKSYQAVFWLESRMRSSVACYFCAVCEAQEGRECFNGG